MAEAHACTRLQNGLARELGGEYPDNILAAELERIEYCPGENCVCGTAIHWNYVLATPEKQVIIGSQCIKNLLDDQRKVGYLELPPTWQHMRELLEMETGYARVRAIPLLTQSLNFPPMSKPEWVRRRNELRGRALTAYARMLEVGPVDRRRFQTTLRTANLMGIELPAGWLEQICKLAWPQAEQEQQFSLRHIVAHLLPLIEARPQRAKKAAADLLPQIDRRRWRQGMDRQVMTLEMLQKCCGAPVAGLGAAGHRVIEAPSGRTIDGGVLLTQGDSPVCYHACCSHNGRYYVRECTHKFM